MKRIKKLIILAVVFALLTASYFIVNSVVKKNEEDNAETDAETYTVAEIDSSSLKSLSITKRSTDEDGSVTDTVLRFSVKEDKSGWVWDSDTSVPLDSTAFNSIVTSLNENQTTLKLSDITEAELETYGLSKPSIKAVFTYSDGSTYSCELGNINSFNSKYYFRSSSDSTAVYMVDSTVMESMDVTIYDVLLYDELPEISTSNIKTVTYTKGDDTFVYTYYPTGKDAYYTDEYKWFLSVNGADELPVSVDAGDALAAAVTDREFLAAVAYDRSKDTELGLDNPGVMTVAYKKAESVEDSTTGSTTEVYTDASFVLYLGEIDEDGYYYARTADSNLAYTLSYSDDLDLAFIEEGRNMLPKELLKLNIEYVDKLVFEAGSERYAVCLTHADGATSYKDESGNTIDYDKYSALIENLTGIEAESDTAFLDPDETVEKKVLFSVDFTFNRGEVKNAELTVSSYSQNYCIVSFMGRTSQLITKDEANELVSLLDDIFAEAA